MRFAPTGFLGTPEETSGSFPLPPGTVSAAYDNQAGRSTYSVSIPTGLHLLPVLPATETDFLLVNGEPVDEDSKIVWTDHSVTLAVLPGSDYVFEVRRETS